MVPLDDGIVGDLSSNPRSRIDRLAARLDDDVATVRRRCRLLADAGLLDEVYRGRYQPTRVGCAYLTGALDASSLPGPDEE